jgi:CD109 antigen
MIYYLFPEFKMYWNLTKTPDQSSWEYNYYQSPALEVEVAAYALLYLIDSRQLSTGYPIMRWLVSQRNSLGGFRSTQVNIIIMNYDIMASNMPYACRHLCAVT